jgi:uncharacterized RDD family membrane protein YckC
MDWYYVDAGNRVGPVSEAEFEQLAATGKLQANTLVWREGMANWQPFAQVRPVASSGAVTTPAAPIYATTPVASPTGDDVVCTQCNRIFPRQETIQYGESYVCAACKPIFMQRLKEGAVTPTVVGALNYAGFWIRFGAKLIDGLILGVVIGLPVLAFVLLTMRKGGGASQITSAMMGFQLGLQLMANLLTIAYYTFMQGKYGATLGKMACGLKVVRSDGSSLTYGRAFGRALAEILSGLICYIGYIIAAFDGQKRALHDHIADTRVIRIR